MLEMQWEEFKNRTGKEKDWSHEMQCLCDVCVNRWFVGSKRFRGPRGRRFSFDRQYRELTNQQLGGSHMEYNCWRVQ